MHTRHFVERHPLLLRSIWALLLSIGVVASAAALGRATRNFNAALVDKPDVAIYLLLPDENIGPTITLKTSDTERVYLAKTATSSLLVTLRKGPKEWYVASKERLHGGASSQAPVEGTR